jgi:hypothetical protein
VLEQSLSLGIGPNLNLWPRLLLNGVMYHKRLGKGTKLSRIWLGVAAGSVRIRIRQFKMGAESGFAVPKMSKRAESGFVGSRIRPTTR